MLAPTSDAAGPDWTWLNLGLELGHEASAQSPAHPPPRNSNLIQGNFSEMLAVDRTSFSNILVGNFSGEVAFCRFEEVQTVNPNHLHVFNFEIQERNPVEIMGRQRVIAASCAELSGNAIGSQTAKDLSTISLQYAVNDDQHILPNFRSQSSKVPLFHLPTLPIPLKSAPPSFEVPEVIFDSHELKRSYLESTPPAIESSLELGGHSVMGIGVPGELPEYRNPSTIKRRCSRDSVPSIASLNRRLSSKYSPSRLEDIMSLMERHTISGSSASFCSSARDSQVSSERSLKSVLGQCKMRRSLDAQPTRKPRVLLPGAFRSNWMAMTDRIVGSASSISWGINEIDRFGNSILHVAASMNAPVKYLIYLIKEKANIHTKNTGGETFLHLVHAPTEEDDVCSMLEILSADGFNFAQYDQQGQTSLHLLTRPWLPQQYLVKLIRKIHSLRLVLPSSRDNLGFTLLNQMLGLTSETQNFVVRPCNPEHSANLMSKSKLSLHYQEEQTNINNMEAQQQYEHHANLLRTVVKAGDMPWYEDSKGCNGLHCLAEVAFDLPLPKMPGWTAQYSVVGNSGNAETLRECYLDGLLAAGVNPNNYNVDGNTPLMAFITHNRPSEDDATTTRILIRLIDGKADIHRRNRQGETALHLAVKLGRRAATQFLLENNANVHACDNKRAGILEVGYNAWGKATSDARLYGQIMACMSLVTSSGAVSYPTIDMEWIIKEIKPRKREGHLFTSRKL